MVANKFSQTRPDSAILGKKPALLLIIVGALYVLHQDFWFWRAARPLVFGFIPIGLFYHACYTVATAIVMWLLVKHAWPSHLEDGGGEARGADGATGRVGEGAPRLPVSPSPPLPLSSPVAADREGTEK
jgi:hypothetical protein